MKSPQRNFKTVLIIGLSLTSIIPFLVIVYFLTYLSDGGPTFQSRPIVVGVTLFLAFLGIYVLLNISNAISKISKSADTLARGDLTQAIEPVHKDTKEVVTLTGSLNSIAQQLVSNIDEMERRAILLERANTELEAVSNKKTEFISIVSHELRAPLINMKQAVALMMNRKLGDVTPDQKKTLDLIERNVERLMHLISELLDMSAIDTGKLNLIKKEEDLKELISESVNTVDRWREAKNINLALDLPQKIPAVYVDSDKIVQVFTNLLSNAIKYTSPGGNVEISAAVVEKDIQQTEEEGKPLIAAKGKFVEVSVTDTGIGIAKEDQDKVFERFTKLNKTGNTPQSSGLGLSIVKDIIKLHKAQIAVESEEGKGSTFKVCLPVSSGK